MRHHQTYLWLFAFFGLVLFTSCDIETDNRRASYAKRHLEIKRILVALEMWRDKQIFLPTTLQELSTTDSTIQGIDLRQYEYNPNGLTMSDGSRWIISTINPMDPAHHIVGRLPYEVDVRTRK